MLRTLTFGDLDSGVWGAAWELGNGAGFALIGANDIFAAPDAMLTGDWSLTGDGVELESSASGEPAELEDGFDDLATIRGRARIGDTERMIECVGRRGERRAFDPTAYESVRDVSAWFSVDDAIFLLAARPPGNAGHGNDLITASAFESRLPLPIDEPRLSTTYGPDSAPVRAGLELWLEQQEPGDGSEENSEHVVLHPLRAAGEAVGVLATTAAGSLAVEARLFRWHARGRDGAGVYVLARSR
jgi:hypothetical protein